MLAARDLFHDKIGDVLVAQGNLEATLDSFKASLAIGGRLAGAPTAALFAPVNTILGSKNTLAELVDCIVGPPAKNLVELLRGRIFYWFRPCVFI